MPPAAKRPNKRMAQGARSRDEILDAASRMMATRGFEGTSVADIARESGLPNSSIYWHFNSKAGILAAVMERGAERFFADVRPSPALPDETPDAHLHRALRGVGEVFVAHPEFLRLFVILLLGNESDDIREIVHRVRERGRQSLNILLQATLGPWGEATAARVSDRIVDFALAGFDGAFLALQAGSPTSHETLMSQLADSVMELACGEREVQPSPPP
ncbi:TetR/AcrR family transcriptional regulator [Rhodococcus opacus]|uniref:TetR/AcrR family transcriptional regulator n=1 Tax=Rhodococcus opacus TaxID=37919 RepID=UPI001FF3CE75|nr:TetR/AcrR family transcriptional regulator [Rhodococcus opacus]UOT03726.1 TetR/AcrR family transcriptional regulator [Rhodococcus opacus]